MWGVSECECVRARMRVSDLHVYTFFIRECVSLSLSLSLYYVSLRPFWVSRV